MNAHVWPIVRRGIRVWRAEPSADARLVASVFASPRRCRAISRRMIYRPGKRPIPVVVVRRG